MIWNSLEVVIQMDGDLHENMHVIIDYEQELFPGKITEVLPNEFVHVSCMETGGSKGSTWKWPKKDDDNAYPMCDILQTNITLNIMPGTARNVEFHVPELDHISGKPITNSFFLRELFNVSFVFL